MIYDIYMKSSDAKASKCHLKFSSKMSTMCVCVCVFVCVYIYIYIYMYWYKLNRIIISPYFALYWK